MAEILLSLTIIGVVAAITLPSLTGNINERTWNTQRKALYARISQAVSLMPALNGYGELKEASSEGASDAVDTVAETFITSGLSKVLKINNICDVDHLTDCGLPSKLITIKNSVVSPFPSKLTDLQPVFDGKYVNSGGGYSFIPNSTPAKIANAAAFETANGESIAVYYNPNCVADMDETSSYDFKPKLCVNFIYDLNGTKGPNTVGKDVGFISVLYPTDSVVVAPETFHDRTSDKVSQLNGSKFCAGNDNAARLPNKHEAMAMFFNEVLLEGRSHMVTSSVYDNKAWFLEANAGYMALGARDTEHWARCVKR